MLPGYANFIVAIKRLQEAGLHEFADSVQAVVDEMMANAIALIPEWEQAHALDVIMRAIDQVIDRGNATVSEVFTDYVLETGIAAQMNLAKVFGLTVEQIADITQIWVQNAAANDYQLIRQIITPLRNDIIQVFTDALAQGLHPSEIENMLNGVGLPWSPTGQFSPGQRAQMIAATEFGRISEGMSDNLARAAGIEDCYNDLNQVLRTHADICLAATDAGLIPIDEMVSRFGKPPRHPNCGCALEYVLPEWYEEGKTEAQLDEIRGQGVDVDAALERFEETGDKEKQDADNWRDNLNWENAVIDKLFTRENANANA